VRRDCPRRRPLALRARLPAGFRAPRLARLRLVAPSLAAFATACDAESLLLLPRRAFFHARRAVAASFRASLASRRASLNRLRARFNCSLASLICCRATSARSFAVAKDSAGASSVSPRFGSQTGPARASLSTEPVHNSVYKCRRPVTGSQKHGDCARAGWIEHFLISSQLQRSAIAAGSVGVIKTAPHECRLALLPLLFLLLAERHRRIAGA
jgi:hypothetical protein